jgi:N-acetylglucosamine-6-phosphate deacetylase
MASQYPAEFLGLGHRFGRIAPGHEADLVLMSDRLEVLRTWVAGEPAGSG